MFSLYSSCVGIFVVIFSYVLPSPPSYLRDFVPSWSFDLDWCSSLFLAPLAFGISFVPGFSRASERHMSQEETLFGAFTASSPSP